MTRTFLTAIVLACAVAMTGPLAASAQSVSPLPAVPTQQAGTTYEQARNNFIVQRDEFVARANKASAEIVASLNHLKEMESAYLDAARSGNASSSQLDELSARFADESRSAWNDALVKWADLQDSRHRFAHSTVPSLLDADNDRYQTEEEQLWAPLDTALSGVTEAKDRLRTYMWPIMDQYFVHDRAGADDTSVWRASVRQYLDEQLHK